MEQDRFEEPVWVYVGLNIPRPLETAMQAFVFLDECPASLRGFEHAGALEACRSAVWRDVSPETARAALVRFAERRGILAPDIGAALAARQMTAGAAVAA